MDNIVFKQESVYLQGILNNINKHDRSLVDCKQTHMMKRGAPCEKVRVPSV